MSFSWKEYTQELKAVVKGWWPTTLVKRLAHRSFYRPSFDEVMIEKKSEGNAEMKRTLTGLDLLMFGVGERPSPPCACTNLHGVLFRCKGDIASCAAEIL